MKLSELKNTKVDTDLFVHVFAFISVLLIGADIWGVNVGVNLRLDQIFLLVLSFLLLLKNGFALSKNKFVAAFCAFALISAIGAVSPVRGVIFYCSIIYNVFFVYLCFYNYVLIYGTEKFVSILRKTCYVQFLIILLQFALKVLFKYELPFLPGYGEYMGVYRFCIWFYEPSYLATYMTFWLTLSLSKLLLKKDYSYVKDCVLCLLVMLISTSSSGFAGIAFSFILVYVLWLFGGISLKKLSVIFVAAVGVMCVKIFLPNLFDAFISRIFSGDLNGATGGRVEGWTETLEVFKKNVLFGVGPGCYGIYLGKGTSYVPTNVTLELMATLGIFAAVAFYAFTVWLVVKSFKIYGNRRDDAGFTLFALALSLIVFTVILQVNQGYLRLYHWMFFGVIAGGIKRYGGGYVGGYSPELPLRKYGA